MYQLENVIRSTTRTLSDKLNIIVFCDNEEDYICQLCETGHNFYIFKERYPSQWKRDPQHTPLNLHLQKNEYFSLQRGFDLIIVFNRFGQWEKGNELSRSWHLPLIVVDMASSASKIQHPFFANFNIDKPEIMHQRSGMISVGGSDTIKQSWISNTTRFATTIVTPHNPVERSVAPQTQQKIAIDSDLPQQYMTSLPIVLDSNKFTTALSEAAFYLHLWQTVTPKMLEAMALGIPVITLQSTDFQDFIEKEAVILVENVNMFAQPNIVQELKKFGKTEEITNNALAIVTSDHYPEQFVRSWENVFEYSRNLFYTRG